MIISGPGEIPFSHFTQRFEAGEDVTDTPSSHIRRGDDIIITQRSPEYDMSETPFMYGDLEQFKNKIVYYETSRGCPFRCAYCMSAGTGVSFLSTERVKAELEYFMKSGLRQVKLVDRTFNYPPSRAKEIIDALISISERYPDSPANFHFEITASLLDDETLSLLKTARKGLIRLEAGIQSTNAETLHAIQRGSDTDKLLDNLRALCRMDNIHVHADLIAGLPLESYSSFASSFNDAYSLKPSALQLGFLKLLKGSPLRCEAEKYGIVCTDYAPYEVLQTGAISYEELSKLHLIENTLNMLYNSGHCLKTLEHIMPYFDSPFAFFEAFALYLDCAGYFSRPQTMKSLFEHIYTFSSARGCPAGELSEALAFDWLCLEKPRTWPAYLSVFAEANRAELRAFLGIVDNIKSYLPAYKRLSPAEISKRIFVCTLGSIFPGKTLLFNYGRRRGEDGFCQEVPVILNESGE
jgi:anaerobic magnesium-protoporphyrin IX monomethyl ester cyclase